MNVAMLSNWHVHANGYAKEIAADPRVTITAVWSENADTGRAWAADLNAKFYENLDELLADPTIDAVACCAPTNMHGEILVKAANAGKHIFTEKVLALTSAQAYAIRDAVLKNGIHFTISYPHKTNRALLKAKALVDEGKLGTLTYARVRNVHSGSIRNWLPPHFYDRTQCGGGAMIDLGAHPMYLLEWFLGQPLAVSSSFTNVTDRPVEDNAVSLLEFAGGAIGVSETGFVSLCDPFIVEVSGTRGYLCVRDGLMTIIDGERHDYTDSELTETRPAPIPYWLDSIANNTPNLLYGIDEAVSLTELMEAAYISSTEGKKAPVHHQK